MKKKISIPKFAQHQAIYLVFAFMLGVMSELLKIAWGEYLIICGLVIIIMKLHEIEENTRLI